MKIMKQYQYQFCLALYLCIIYHFPTFEILVLLLLTNFVNGFHDCLSNLNIILNILRKSKSNREFVYEEYVIVIFAKVIILSKTLSYNVSLKHTFGKHNSIQICKPCKPSHLHKYILGDPNYLLT